MANANTQTREVLDASASVINELRDLDVKSMSYVQLRRLNGALIHASQTVANESAARAENVLGGDTVRVTSPRFDQPR